MSRQPYRLKERLGRLARRRPAELLLEGTDSGAGKRPGEAVGDARLIPAAIQALLDLAHLGPRQDR